MVRLANDLLSKCSDTPLNFDNQASEPAGAGFTDESPF